MAHRHRIRGNVRSLQKNDLKLQPVSTFHGRKEGTAIMIYKEVFSLYLPTKNFETLTRTG